MPQIPYTTELRLADDLPLDRVQVACSSCTILLAEEGASFGDLLNEAIIGR
jgi:hypothetical protein